MKKTAVLLAIAVLLLSVAGCGGDQSATSDVDTVTTTAKTISSTSQSTTTASASTTATTTTAGTTAGTMATTTTMTQEVKPMTTTTTTTATQTTRKTVDLKGWRMKNIMILGDSISTFKGHIYEDGGEYYGPNIQDNNVNRVTYTWWYRFAKKNRLNVVQNNSYSGSTIGYTGYDGGDNSVGPRASFITRLQVQAEADFFAQNEIDTVLVFGGTNDSWANAPVGEVQYSGFEKEDLYNVLPATCYLMQELKKAVPNGQIIWIINDGLNQDMCAGMVEAAKHYDISYVWLDDIETQAGHPNIKGMRAIDDQLVAMLDEQLPGWNG